MKVTEPQRLWGIFSAQKRISRWLAHFPIAHMDTRPYYQVDHVRPLATAATYES